jgi:hypothetical protein
MTAGVIETGLGFDFSGAPPRLSGGLLMPPLPLRLLEAETRLACLAVGLDPGLGFFTRTSGVGIPW